MLLWRLCMASQVSSQVKWIGEKMKHMFRKSVIYNSPCSKAWGKGYSCISPAWQDYCSYSTSFTYRSHSSSWLFSREKSVYNFSNQLHPGMKRAY